MNKILPNLGGLFFSSGLFLFLFILHIFFASNELWFLFKVVVISIFFTSHFHSLIVFYFSKNFEKKLIIKLIRISTLLSILYSVGFWFAVNDMNFNLWIIFTGLFPVSLYLFLLRYLITDNSKEMTNTNHYDEPNFNP